MTSRLHAEFACDFCGETLGIGAEVGADIIEAPAPWMSIPTRDCGLGAMGLAHFCSLPCAWWAVRDHQANPSDTVTIIGRGGVPYGPGYKGWDSPARPRRLRRKGR